MRPTAVLLLALLALAPAAAAQDRGPGPRGGPPGPLATVEPGPASGIAWFPTWEAGRAEAKRTGRPVLLVSAAPHCHGTPGIW